MTSRLHLIAALVIVGAALSTVPAGAVDSVAGNRGSGDKGQSRDAPFTLPAAVKPQPTPKVDGASLSRGIFDMDQDDALAGLATVTLSSDGTINGTPASGQLRDAFETSVQGHKASH